MNWKEPRDMRLTRRRFLMHATASLGALAGAWEIAARDLPSHRGRYPHWMIQEVANVSYELRVYREILVPLLVREVIRKDQSPHSEINYAILGRGNPETIRAFRHGADRLRDALRDPTARFDPKQAFAATNAASTKCARSHFLTPHHVDEAWVADRCEILNGRFVWRIPIIMRSYPRPSELSALAQRFLDFINEPIDSDDPVTQLRTLGPERLMRGCRGFTLGTFQFDASQLFCIVPEAPPDIFRLPFENPDFFPHGRLSSEEMFNWSMMRGIVSTEVCMTMGFLASNHFLRIVPLARRPEINGGWLEFMPGQVLDVLYQKVLALRYLRGPRLNGEVPVLPFAVVEAMKLGAVDYLPKPFTPDQVRAAARRVVTALEEIVARVSIEPEVKAVSWQRTAV